MSGIVVCVDPRAADEGAKVLEAGVNAFDAAIATAFVQMVVMPFSCGVGGMASAHLWKRETGQHFVVDGLLRAGSLVADDMWAADHKGESEIRGGSLFEDFRSDIGYRSICTPGAVAAFAQVHRRVGSLPWGDLLRPAIDRAREGFLLMPVTPSPLVEEPTAYEPDQVARVQATAECARLYFRDTGTVPADGETFRNLDYASTLQRLADHGPEDFYTGELADAIVTDLERNGAFVTSDDLRQYRASVYTPSVVAYQGNDVYSNISPGGGPLLLEALNVLDNLGLGDLEHSSAQHLGYLASTFQLVNQDRRSFLGDPEHIGHEPFLTLISQERATKLREAVVNGVVGGVPPSPSLRTPPT